LIDRARSKPPAKAIAGQQKPLRIQAASLDWKWLFIYPDQKIASIKYAHRSRRRAAAIRVDLGKRDERVLHPATRRHDLHHERHTSRLNLRADAPGDISRPHGAFKRPAKTIGISSIRSSILTDGFAINEIAAMLEMSRAGPHRNPNVGF
jgi:hypothetical protein